MRTEVIKCDVCRAEIENNQFLTLTLPIVVEEERGRRARYAEKEMDVCNTCVELFARLYYKVANENHWTGLRQIEQRRL